MAEGEDDWIKSEHPYNQSDADIVWFYHEASCLMFSTSITFNFNQFNSIHIYFHISRKHSITEYM